MLSKSSEQRPLHFLKAKAEVEMIRISSETRATKYRLKEPNFKILLGHFHDAGKVSPQNRV